MIKELSYKVSGKIILKANVNVQFTMHDSQCIIHNDWIWNIPALNCASYIVHYSFTTFPCHTFWFPFASTK